VTVESGTNVIAGTTRDKIAAAIRRQIGRRHGKGVPKNWDGHAAARILDVLIDTYQERAASLDSHVSAPCA
jgi:UDP-N-acetylglucosamine 2-epimerase